MGGMKKMKPVTVHLSDPYIKALDELVRRKLYANRAEAIRMAVRDLLKNHNILLEYVEE